MDTYTTIQGDMWDSISQKIYGDVKYTDVLINANTEYHDTYIFGAGVVLETPEVDELGESSDLPPWKRVKG